MPGEEIWLKAFFLLHNLSYSGDIINRCHWQEATVNSGVISPATAKYHLVFCIDYVVNHSNTAVLFYNNIVSSLCLDHKSVSPATALPTIATLRLKKKKSFLPIKMFSVFCLCLVSSNYMLTCSMNMSSE